MAKRGRPNHAAALLKRIAGSPEAKERVLTILESLSGTVNLKNTLARLQIGATIFRRLRSAFLRCTVQALEPKPPGRPQRQVPPHWRRIRELEREIQGLKRELKFSRIREELALIMRGPSKNKRLSKAKPVGMSADAPLSPPSIVIKKENPGPLSPPP